MGYIQVTARELRNGAQEIQNLNSQFKAKASELSEKERALCGMWEGSARDAFHQAFTGDGQQLENFHQLIAEYVRILTDIATRYEQAEARNKEIASARSY